MKHPDQQPEAEFGKRDKISTHSRKANPRAANSLGMARLLSNPQDSATPKHQSNKASMFIQNQDAPMQKLSDLDRKTKHAFMKT